MTRRSAEDVFYGENAGKTRHSGLESQLSYQLLAPDLSERELSLTFTHTYMHNRFVVFEDEQGDHRGNTLPAQPAHMLHLKLQIRSARGAGLQIRYHRSEEHTSELQSRPHLVCRLLLEKKKSA